MQRQRQKQMQKQMQRHRQRHTLKKLNDPEYTGIYASTNIGATVLKAREMEKRGRGRSWLGGGKKRKIRKHRGIYQSGAKKGRLKSGYKYTGKLSKTGLKIIAKK